MSTPINPQGNHWYPPAPSGQAPVWHQPANFPSAPRPPDNSFYTGGAPIYHAPQAFYGSPSNPQPMQPMLSGLPIGGHPNPMRYQSPAPGPVSTASAMSRAAEAVDPNTLGSYNKALEGVDKAINRAMTPLQSALGRSLTIVGSLVALGGGVAAGLLGLGALGAAASAVGLPVAAVAGLAGAAVFVGGIAIAVAAGAIARSLVRSSLKNEPTIEAKLNAVRELRDQLRAKPNLNKGEKQLLHNADKVLGKVEGFGSHLKSQMKLSGKTIAIPVVFLPIAALSVFGNADLGNFSSNGMSLNGHDELPVDVNGGESLLHRMNQR
jgi:hypothetical protein